MLRNKNYAMFQSHSRYLPAKVHSQGMRKEKKIYFIRNEYRSAQITSEVPLGFPKVVW